METDEAKWRPCSSCKGDIDFGEVYYVCDVPTCNRGATDLRFCSIECWDVHVPVMRHRNPGAVEKRAPAQAEWEREQAKARPAPSAPRPATPTAPPEGEVELVDEGLPHDVLVVVSKGSVEIVVGEMHHRLAAGDAIQFEADSAHEYRNVGAGEAVMYLVMTYASTRAGPSTGHG